MSDQNARDVYRIGLSIVLAEGVAPVLAMIARDILKIKKGART